LYRVTRSWKEGMGEDGSTIVEFAMVLISFLTLLFGMLDLSRALYVYNYVSDAARDGTRFAMVRGSACSHATFPTACPATATDVETYLRTTKLSPGINPNAVMVATSWPGGNPGCASPLNSPGCIVKVRVQYNFGFMLPFLPKLSTQMRSTSQMVISQ
jgi:hypothetical protein